MLNTQLEPDSAKIWDCQKNLVPVVGTLSCWQLCHVCYCWAAQFNVEQLRCETKASFKHHLCITFWRNTLTHFNSIFCTSLQYPWVCLNVLSATGSTSILHCCILIRQLKEKVHCISRFIITASTVLRDSLLGRKKLEIKVLWKKPKNNRNICTRAHALVRHQTSFSSPIAFQ